MGGLLGILGGATTSANDSTYDAIQQRATRAIEAVRAHKHLEKKTPCGFIHFDVVEALDAQYEMSNVSYQFVKTFARQVFAACLSSCLLGGTGTGVILHVMQKRDQAATTKAAIERNQGPAPAERAAVARSVK